MRKKYSPEELASQKLHHAMYDSAITAKNEAALQSDEKIAPLKQPATFELEEGPAVEVDNDLKDQIRAEKNGITVLEATQLRLREERNAAVNKRAKEDGFKKTA